MNKINILEGILFIKGEEGLSNLEIAKILDIDIKEVKDIIDSLNQKLEGTALVINSFGDKYKLVTREEYFNYYKDYLRENPVKLTDSLVETAIIVAYNQPVTKAFVDSIRGVDSGDALRRLKNYNLIEVAGRSDAPGRPMIYVTNNNFLDHFGLKSLEDLPPINEENDIIEIWDE